MKHLIFTFLIFLTVNYNYGQPKTPEGYGLKPFSITDKDLGEVNFYVTKKGIENEKPLVVLLDGSGHYPIYSLIKKDDGTSQIYGSMPFNYKALANKFHVALVSKPGTPFLDSLNVNSYDEFLEQYKPSNEYNEKLSLSWRANSASKIIDYLTKNLKIDTNKIIAIGYSEGGQVVPKLATLNNKLTKIVNIVGGGLNQFNDFVSAERLKAQLGIISSDSAQIKIDNLFLKFQDIYNHPTSTDKFWLGHTYKRWASFCKDIPLDNMLRLDIPMLLIAADLDKNSPINGLDYVPLEFARQGKTNLTYKVYTNCDHWFDDQKLKTNRKAEMLEYVNTWIEK